MKSEGRCAWTSDDPAIVTPDLWVGFLGPASALARHAAGLRDALLSPAGLARIARAALPACDRPARAATATAQHQAAGIVAAGG